MKNVYLTILAGLFLVSCNKGPTAEPDVCANQSMDFQSCLECCQDNGFSGASLPTDNSGNTTTCECEE